MRLPITAAGRLRGDAVYRTADPASLPAFEPLTACATVLPERKGEWPFERPWLELEIRSMEIPGTDVSL